MKEMRKELQKFDSEIRKMACFYKRQIFDASLTCNFCGEKIEYSLSCLMTALSVTEIFKEFSLENISINMMLIQSLDHYSYD